MNGFHSSQNPNQSICESTKPLMIQIMEIPWFRSWKSSKASKFAVENPSSLPAQYKKHENSFHHQSFSSLHHWQAKGTIQENEIHFAWAEDCIAVLSFVALQALSSLTPVLNRARIWEKIKQKYKHEMHKGLSIYSTVHHHGFVGFSCNR